MQKPTLCTKCNEYFAFPSKFHCSGCITDTNLLKQIFSKEEIKKREIQAHIQNNTESLFIVFKSSRHLPLTIVRDNMFPLLKNYLQGKEPIEVFATIQGWRNDFPRLALFSHQADDLLEFVKIHYPIHSEHWKFCHAIYNNIIDFWNCKTTDGVAKCYYLEFGDIKCPRSIEIIEKIWESRFFIPNNIIITTFQGCVIEDCCICSEPMQICKHVLKKCNQCHKYIHLQCINQWKIQSHSNNCPLCQNEFDTGQ